MIDTGKNLLVTGGAGFIGSNFVEVALSAGARVTVLDSLTYAGHLESLAEFQEQIRFVKGDIRDRDLVLKLLRDHHIDGVIHFAAESHVDKSIAGPTPFVETNVVGTLQLLLASSEYYQTLVGQKEDQFRFVQVSTDEVFGALGPTGKFSETTPYQPNSPYSASKAGGDHLARAWFHTYQLPTIITNCSNNYGPKQFPEKLIPHMILSALQGRPMPVYGKGENVRDWIHVKDHALGVLTAFTKGVPGEAYCFGGNSERKNIDVVQLIATTLDELRPLGSGRSYQNQIAFVADRPGHDFRYAIDDSKAIRDLGYQRRFGTFELGLKDTIEWYLKNLDWCKKVTDKPGVKVQYDWAKLG